MGKKLGFLENRIKNTIADRPRLGYNTSLDRVWP